MASMIFNSALFDALTGAVDFDTDTFKVILHTSTFVPDKDLDLKRSDTSDEVAGTGYTAGGNTATVTVTKDTTNDRIDVSLGGTTWPTSTITARYATYYKSRGGVATADEVVATVDFVSNVVSTGATFTLTASTLRIAN